MEREPLLIDVDVAAGIDTVGSECVMQMVGGDDSCATAKFYMPLRIEPGVFDAGNFVRAHEDWWRSVGFLRKSQYAGGDQNGGVAGGQILCSRRGADVVVCDGNRQAGRADEKQRKRA